MKINYKNIFSKKLFLEKKLIKINKNKYFQYIFLKLLS